MERMFHTTFGASWSGLPSTYLIGFTVHRENRPFAISRINASVFVSARLCQTCTDPRHPLLICKLISKWFLDDSFPHDT